MLNWSIWIIKTVTCSSVGTGYYSPSSNNTRYTCTSLPSNGYWTSDWNGSNNCNFACYSGWTKSGNSCIDNTDPIAGSPVYTPSGWTNTDVTVTVSCTETWGSGCSQPSFNTVRTANGSWTIPVTDNAWNTVNRGFNVTNIDKTDPSVSANNSTTTWKNSNILITLYASDSGWSGLSQARYSWSNSLNWACTSGWSTYSNGATITKSSTSAQTLYLCARDVAWNTDTWTWTYRLDKTPAWMPTINSSSHSNGVWHNVNTASMTIVPWSSGPSPATTYYCNDTTDSCTPTTAGTSRTLSWLSNNGNHQFRARTCDTGWCSSVRSFNLKIDRTLPNAPVTYTSSIPNGPTGWDKMRRYSNHYMFRYI